MRKMEFMLKDPFEVTGQWWVPEKPDDKIYGTLRYSPADIELKLNGTLDDVTAKELVAGSPKFKDHPCIHGLTHDHQRFTLLRAHAWSLGSTTKYGAFHVIADKKAKADMLIFGLVFAVGLRAWSSICRA